MDQGVPSLYGVPLKYVSLVTLTVQNSALILIMHYSRVMPAAPGTRYFTSTAVLLNEILKLLLCCAVVVRDKAREGKSWSLVGLWHEIFGGDAWKLTIPAALYTLQNNLQYIAVSNLDAATFQVTYQLKILTTALFSITLLHRSLSGQKWLSLLLLTFGVALVQLPAPNPEAVKKESFFAKHFHLHSRQLVGHLINKQPPAVHDEEEMNRTLGLVAVFAACLISGLAGVYFEKVLKTSNASLWTRNVQLSFFSLFPALFIGVLWKDGQQVLEKGFFHGYNPVVWTAIGFQAIGGIVVALCVAYADNILKNFATSVSILISFVASVYFFNFVVTRNFVFGCAIVLFATYLYTKPERVVQPYSRVPSTLSLNLDEEGKVGHFDESAPKSAGGRDLEA